ncbi:citrate synthase/methylcitrate synthase [Phreatobacter stygius]|uniref:Citrate synthase n=1 Tax=Phreatobacter stygius TaxID=1940610 RepID=A0A4D7AXR7_9HYPH|nr:citrate synthase/methylcitrate synthase [Phreatobacter stygius]QCI64941.1 citrate synthase/methylcitrate synthase [Phreatobacter stygius]
MSSGLDDVIAAETVLSHVDGAAGRLIVRGFDLDELAGQRSFEAVLALLWDGFVAESMDEQAIRAALGKARVAAYATVGRLIAATDGLSAVESLRLLLAALPDAEPTPHHVLAVAAVPVFAAAIARRKRGLAPVAPDESLGQAEDCLRMMRGQAVPAAHARALEAYLVTVADHGLNASTFAARVIASTRAGLLSAVVGALCALKGPLHGGAPGPVLDMLDAIGTPANIRPWLASALADGARLMGFGHRIYRVRDPRADVLKGVAADLSLGNNRIRFAEEVEAGALELLREHKAGRSLDTNVEFYTALVLEALELPRDSFTNVFATGRVAGWTAHVLEQEQSGRIIRPQSHYTGPMPGQLHAA